MDLIICQSIVATSATLVGLFASGEWKGLMKEIEEYELGKVSYIMTITWAAITSQVFLIGAIGLIFEVSSLFCNAISVLSLPVVPVLAVIVFHDKMDGVKVISMVLAIWGIVSYIYQQYLVESEEDEEAKQGGVQNEPLVPVHRPENVRRWIRIAIHAFFILSGQSAATLLGALYFKKGGNSKWMATLVQLAGFPVLFPYYCIPQSKKTKTVKIQTKTPTFLVLASVYVFLGLFTAVYCYLYSVGLMYLPVSTFSLICASQLAFNAFFSFFLNSQKFTPFIINSLMLLTISSTLIVFQKQDDSPNPTGVSKGKYAIGFICTVAASAGYGLLLSLLQLAFKKVMKSETFTAVMDMVIYSCLVASCVAFVGLFASKEWKTIPREMEEYELGKVSYVLTLVWIGIAWQVFNIGALGLIFETSSLFSNAISVVGLPIVPILAVVFFHDKMDGLKVISLVLAIWGFLSYVYQHYLDECQSKTNDRRTNVVSSASSTGNQ
ncbi:hypothetical protein LWI29_020160 [Acer saccharum]|uniref:Probable purine permease n=1 Tax=Acer saccharum TaxID=4024 RepID=A0AA39RI74_ACESA|nr:hypothetical protein LWI29_020160 [Acer saccharum]